METVDKIDMSLDDIIALQKRQKKLPNKVKLFNARIGNKKVSRTSTVQKTKTQQRRKLVSSQPFSQPAQIKQKHEHLKKLKPSKLLQQQKLSAVRQEKLSNKKRQKQARQNLLSQKRKLPLTTPKAVRSRKQLQPIKSGGYKAGMIADSVQQKKRRWGNNNADSGIMTISVSNTKSYNDPVVLIGRTRGKRKRPVINNESQSNSSFSGQNQQGRGLGRIKRHSRVQQIEEMKPVSKQEFSFERIQLGSINFTTGKSLNDRFSQNVSVKRRGSSTIRGQGGHSGRGERTVFL